MTDMLEQMRQDFANMTDPPGGGPMARARKLVEDHIARHGPIPKAESLIDEIAAEMALMQIFAIDRHCPRTR